ncbi:MAG: hypothetical protein LW832_05660, partial [Parachlamydia sp.]|nr:hypothetical protein [Parachlamydia sp.]
MRRTLLLFFIFLASIADCRSIPQEALLPANHPLQKKLNELIDAPHLFDNASHWASAGFIVLPRVHRYLMVARHPDCQGYIFKKFQNGIKDSEQLSNYLKRVAGAKKLAQFISKHQLQHITVPQKWLYKLPKNFGKNGTLLIAEEKKLCSDVDDILGENVQRYVNIDYDTLRE